MPDRLTQPNRRRSPGRHRLALLWFGSVYLAFSSIPASVASTLPAPRDSTFVAESVFRHVTTREGLSSDAINSLHQDRSGFLWIATDDGLNRYDGHSVRVYRHDPLDPTSIAGSYVSGVVEDRTGSMWVLLGIGGLDRLDPDTGIAQHFQQSSDSTGLSDQDVYRVLEDREGVVWIATARGLDRFVPGDPPYFERMSGPDGPVYDLELDRADRLWIATESGLFYKAAGEIEMTLVARSIVHRLFVEPHGDTIWGMVRGGGLVRVDRSLQVMDYPPTPEGSQSTNASTARSNTESASASSVGSREQTRLEPDEIVDMGATHPDSIWLVTARGKLLRIHPETGLVRRFLAGFKNGRAPIVRSIYADSTLLAVGTLGGLAIHDRSTDRFQMHRHDPANPASLGHNQVLQLRRDRTGILWIGTGGRGIDLWNVRAMRFPHYRVPDEAVTPPPGNEVISILESSSGTLWLGTAFGLGEYDPSNGSWVRHVRTSDESTLLGPIITSLCESADGSIWIGSNQRLQKLSRPSAIRDPVQEIEISIPIPDGGVRCLVEDRRGTLWIGTPFGLIRRDADSGSLREFPITSDAHGLPSGNVRALLEDGSGAIWIGTYIGGLSRLDPESERFTHYLQSPGSDRAPNNKSVTDLFEDSRGRLWVGTYSGGLNLFDRTTGLFHYYTTREGLPGNKVDGILEDARGQLWIATHQGLSCFDPEAATFRHFDSSDGLQGNRFSIGCRLRTRSGDLIFGGSDGFNRFDPEKLITNPVPPPVAITSFRLFDREVSLDSLRTPDGLRLRPGDDFFSFEFAALDFGNPERNQYAYRLDGFDDDWVYSGSRRYAAYTNLDPGRYEFRVKAANSDGIWNEAGITIPLQILPPFYRTWWFYLVTALTLGWAGWLAHRVRVRQHVTQFLALERVRVAERERIREQISRDYHDALGHKITKISLFSALAERNLEPSEHAAIPYLRKVSEATQDLSRETRGFIWMLNPTKDHFYEVATHLHEFGTDLFEDTNVQVEVRGLDEGLRSIRVPVEWKRDVTLLFREALHNSLKHSDCGNVRLEFRIERGARASYPSTSHPAGTARIELTDDGCGFTELGDANSNPSEAELSARSSSGSRTHSNGAAGMDTGDGAHPSIGMNGGWKRAPRRGNGLENMFRRAQTVGGRLEIESAPGTGTRIRFMCPILEDPQNRGVWRPTRDPLGSSST